MRSPPLPRRRSRSRPSACSPAAAAPLATEVGYRNDGGAAALGAFAAIAGTIAMIAASHHDRGPAYEAARYGYGYAPAPYAYAPRYGSDWWRLAGTGAATGMAGWKYVDRARRWPRRVRSFRSSWILVLTFAR